MRGKSKECEHTRKLVKELKCINALVFAVVGGNMQAPGWPDRYVHHKHWQGWLEMKDKAAVSSLQAQRIKELNARAPGSAFVIRFPNLIEDENGNELGTFSSAWELIETLKELSR